MTVQHQQYNRPAMEETTAAEKAFQEEEKPWKPRTVTVEPVLFFFTFALALQGPAVSALVYRKVCLSKYDVNVCDNLKNSSNHAAEDDVQGGSSHWFLYHNLCFEIPAVLVSFLYGSLSDNVSRRLTLALPAVGQMLSTTNFVVTSVYLESHVGYTLIGQLISGLFGGWITCCLAAFSYLSEVTTVASRTTRTSIAEGVISYSIATSFFLSGIILDHTSFQFVFSISVGLNVLVVVYTYAWVKDPPRDKQVRKGRLQLAIRTSKHWQRFKDTFLCVFQKRESGGRARLLLLLSAVFSSMVSLNGKLGNYHICQARIQGGGG